METGMKALSIALVVAPVGCGTTGQDDPEPATISEVATYELLAANVQKGAESYGAAMSQAGMGLDMCQSLHADYDQHQRARLSEMVNLSGHMDELMAAHGGMMEADNSCLAGMMMDELEHHHALACASGDEATDRAEAIRHMNAMIDVAGAATARCQEIMDGLTGDDWHFGSMMDGCHMGGDDCVDQPNGGGMMMHCGG